MRLLKLLHNFFLSGLKFLIGLGTKDKSLVKTENFFYVKVWSRRL